MTDPARRPKPAAGKTPANPAAQPARPGAQPARPAAPGAKPVAKAPIPTPAPAPVRRAPEPVEEDEPAPVRRPVRRGGPAESQELDPTTKKGLIAAAVMVIIAAVVWTVVSNKKAKEQAAIDQVVAMVQGFKADIEAVVKNEHADVATIEAAIKRVDSEPEKWKERSTEPEIVAFKSKLVGMKEKIRVKTEFLAAYAACRDAVENSASRSTKELIDTKQKLGEIEGNAETYDPGYPQQIKDWKIKLDHLLVTKMRDEAKAFTSMSSTTAFQGLAKYAEAEDYVYKALIDAKKAKNKADDEAYTAIYRELLAESDAYSEKVITPEFKNAIQWKDLLSGEMVARWSKSKDIPGFSFRIEGGVLVVSPPDPGSKQQGVAAILDQKTDNLRHFALDMEFQIQGVVTMYFHVSPAPANPDNRQSQTYDLVAGQNALKADTKYNLVANFVGSTLTIDFPPIGDQDPIQQWTADPGLNKLRKGGIAFLIPEGARLKITRMRIKEFR
jgi:hypothetical protein